MQRWSSMAAGRCVEQRAQGGSTGMGAAGQGGLQGAEPCAAIEGLFHVRGGGLKGGERAGS